MAHEHVLAILLHVRPRLSLLDDVKLEEVAVGVPFLDDGVAFRISFPVMGVKRENSAQVYFSSTLQRAHGEAGAILAPVTDDSGEDVIPSNWGTVSQSSDFAGCRGGSRSLGLVAPRGSNRGT